MDYISALPLEVLEQVLSHLRHSYDGSLPPFGSSPSHYQVLPLACSRLGLSSLSRTNRHFHYHVSQLVHSTICLSDADHVKRVLAGCVRSPKILHLPRPISDSSKSKALQTWLDDDLADLFSSSLLLELEELSIAGLRSSDAILENLLHLTANSKAADGSARPSRPRRTVNSESDSQNCSIMAGIRRLSLDFEYAKPSSRKSTDCALVKILRLWSETLRQVTISHFEFGSASHTTYFWPALGAISLSYCKLSDPVLLMLFAGNRLESLELVCCSGFSRQGLLAATRSHGRSLKRLKIVFDTTGTLAAVNAIQESSSPRPASLPPSPIPASRSTPTPIHPFQDILDEILSYTPMITCLEFKGPLASSSLDLMILLPDLRQLSISRCPAWSTPYALLTLFPRHQGRSSQLRSIHVDYPYDLLPHCDERSSSSISSGPFCVTRLEEVWGAARSHNIRLSGDVFESVEERMKWANEMILIEMAACQSEGANALRVEQEKMPEPFPRRKFKRPGFSKK